MSKAEERLSRHAERITSVETLQGEMSKQVTDIGSKMDEVQKQLSWQTKVLMLAGFAGAGLLGWIGWLIKEFISVYINS